LLICLQPGLTWTVRVPGAPLIAAAQLQHRIPCWGYVFQEPPAAVAPPPAQQAEQAQQQADADAEDSNSTAAAAGGAAAGQQQGQQQWVLRGRKLVLLGDTCDSTAIAPLAIGCDLLSHEATFCSGAHVRYGVGM